MKKFKLQFLLSLSILFLFSCSKQAPETTVIASGEISNPVADMVTISAGDETYTLDLSEDGTFADTLEIMNEGYYNLSHGQEGTSIYLIPGKAINIKLDSKEFDESLVYSGPGSNASTYLAAKQLRKEEERSNFDVKAFYSADEAEFIKSVDEKNAGNMDFLGSFTDLPLSFTANEKENLNFEKLMNLFSYQQAHSYFMNKTDFEPSSSVTSQFENVDFDNEENFINYDNYRNLSMNYYSSMASEDDIDVVGDKISSLKSPSIKKAVLRNMSYQISPSNEDLSKVVDIILSNADDEDFKSEISAKYESMKALAKGQPSPSFEYANISGEMVSSESLKGKLVYVDVWATWCGPCKREIPYLKEVEEKYKDKGVEFVSISIDKQKDKQKWIDFVNAESLKGVQVIADNDWNSDFVKSYSITGIPRFLLIDENGNILNADAPRPSNPELVELFDDSIG